MELRKFVKTTLKISNLTDEQIDALFYHLDDDQSGTVDVGEIRKFMSAERRPRDKAKEVEEPKLAETAEKVESSLSMISEDGDDNGGFPVTDPPSDAQVNEEQRVIAKKRQASISGLFTAPGADLKAGAPRRSINFKKLNH
jgi:hypothetical protein